MGVLGIEMTLENKIREYCSENNLKFDLLVGMKKNWGIDMLSFAKNDLGKEKVVLEVYGYGENIHFNQTEHTQKYLGVQLV